MPFAAPSQDAQAPRAADAVACDEAVETYFDPETPEAAIGDEADALLSNGDLAGYEAKLDEARALIEQALAGVGG